MVSMVTKPSFDLRPRPPIRGTPVPTTGPHEHHSTPPLWQARIMGSKGTGTVFLSRVRARA